MKVFIETVRGSTTRARYDESTFMKRESFQVPERYPYDYGFIIGTNRKGEDCIDCYVITAERLREGQTVECEPIGLIEMLEDGETDYKVLAVFGHRTDKDIQRADRSIRRFIEAVFREIPGVEVQLGKLRSREEAIAFIEESS